MYACLQTCMDTWVFESPAHRDQVFLYADLCGYPYCDMVLGSRLLRLSQTRPLAIEIVLHKFFHE